MWVDVDAIGSTLSWIVGIILVVGIGFLCSLFASIITDSEDGPAWIGFAIGLVIGGYAFFSWKSWLDWFFSGLTSVTFSIIEIVIIAFITNIIITIYVFFKNRRDEKNREIEFDY